MDAFVGGQSGAGKTFIVIDLAVSVASGEPFFGHKVTERVGVAIFAAEGASAIASRVTVARNHKAQGEILPIAWLGAVPNLADPKESERWSTACAPLTLVFALPTACASGPSSATHCQLRSVWPTRTTTRKLPRRSAP